jgi:hypothetical protein
MIFNEKIIMTVISTLILPFMCGRWARGYYEVTKRLIAGTNLKPYLNEVADILIALLTFGN